MLVEKIKKGDKVIELHKNDLGDIIRRRVYTVNDEPSMTDQSFAKETDVNEVVRRYIKTGDHTLLARQQGVYADVSEITDLQGAYESIKLAEAAFETLPAQVRYRFQNDPTQLVSFLQDPRNLEESIKLGLREAPEATVPQQSSSSSDQPMKEDGKTTS